MCMRVRSHHVDIPTTVLEAGTSVPLDTPHRKLRGTKNRLVLTGDVCTVLEATISGSKEALQVHLRDVLKAPQRAAQLDEAMERPSRIFLNGYYPGQGMVPHHDTTAWFGAVTVQLLGAEEDGLRVYIHDDDNEGLVWPLPPGCGCVLARHQKHSVDTKRATKRASLTVFW